MRNRVIINKNEVLWTVSELISIDVNKRVDWVKCFMCADAILNKQSIFPKGLDDVVTIFDTVEGGYMECPIYMVVTCLNKNKIDFFSNRKIDLNICHISFPETLNEVILKIKEDITYNYVPVLYIYNSDSKSFEKVEYKIGRYNEVKRDSEVSSVVETTADKFTVRPILNTMIEYVEDWYYPEVDFSKNYFVEIPDYYEISYYPNEEDVMFCEFCGAAYHTLDIEIDKYKNIRDAMETAVWFLSDRFTDEVLIEDSFAYYYLTESDDNEDFSGHMRDFNTCISVKIVYKYDDLREFEDIEYYYPSINEDSPYWLEDLYNSDIPTCEDFEFPSDNEVGETEDVEDIDYLDETDKATSADNETFEDINKKISKDMTKDINARSKKKKNK